MLTNETRPWPLNFAELHKGSVVAPEVIEEIVELPRSDKMYALKALSLARRIEDELCDAGNPVVCQVSQDAIRVLTDAEASDYLQRRFDESKRATIRAFATMHRVDVGELTAEQRAQHERRLVVQGKYVQAMKDVKRVLTSEAHKRSLPGLPADVVPAP